MAGTIRYTLNTNVTGATPDVKTRANFFWIADFLDKHPAYSRVASYYNGGTNWLDSGEKTFGVWRNNSSSYGKWDIFVDWSYNTTTDTGTPTWLVGAVNYGVGIGIAWHSSSIAWQGTTNNNGADTFGTFLSHPWKSGSIIFPAANGKFGANSANSNLMTNFRYNAGTGTSRIHCVGDNDNLVFLFSENNDGVFNNSFYFLDYIPVTSSYNLPYMMYCYNADISTVFFTRATLFDEKQSGLSLFSTSSQNKNTCYLPIFEYNNLGTDPLMPVNFETGKIYEYPFLIAQGNATKQYVGYPTFVRAVSKRLTSRDRIGSATRMVVGNGFPDSSVSASIPWDGATNPGGGTSQTGTNEFVTSSNFGMFFSQSSTPLAQTIVSTITTTVTVSVSSSTDLWRYFSGGSYLFSATFPNGQTDIVKVR
jgi:hypothetical protein